MKINFICLNSQQNKFNQKALRAEGFFYVKEGKGGCNFILFAPNYYVKGNLVPKITENRKRRIAFNFREKTKKPRATARGIYYLLSCGFEVASSRCFKRHIGLETTRQSRRKL